MGCYEHEADESARNAFSRRSTASPSTASLRGLAHFRRRPFVRGLAQATLRFHERYGSDFLKITPRGGYAVEAWGCVEATPSVRIGHRPCASCAVRSGEDWKKIRVSIPPPAPGYADEIETTFASASIVGSGTRRCATLFSPLSLAKKLSGDRLQHDLRDHPAAVTGALEAITETLIKFALLALAEGVSGIFYSIQAAADANSDEDYARFGDLRREFLEAIARSRR